jgi:hypothetical protein
MQAAPPTWCLVIARGERGALDCEGSGLGLAIVTDVLAEYGFRLDIGSRRDGGGQITFAVPARASDTGFHSLPYRAASAAAPSAAS